MARSATDRHTTAAQDAMVTLMRAAGRVQQALAEVCSGHGLTHDQYNVLRILRGVHPDGLARYEIGRRLISRAPDVTRLIDRLERQGYVERIRSGEDRRLSLSRITADGLTLLDAMDPEIAALHEALAEPLSDGDRRRLVEMCGALLG